MGGENILYIFHSNFVLRNHAPRKIFVFRIPVSIRTVPGKAPWIEGAQHIPGTGRVVAAVRICMTAESGTDIKVCI